MEWKLQTTKFLPICTNTMARKKSKLQRKESNKKTNFEYHSSKLLNNVFYSKTFKNIWKRKKLLFG